MRPNFLTGRAREHAAQRGFLLESLGLVLLVLSALSLLEMGRKLEADLDNEAVLRGKALATVHNSANDYLVSYSTELLALEDLHDPMEINIGGGNSVTVAKGGFPTVDELALLGKTPPNLSSVALGGGKYQIQIQKIPAGCLAPNCNLEGLVTVDRPYMTDGKVDYSRLGLTIGAVGDDGAFSRRLSPTVLSGYGGKWSTDNPSIPGLGQVAGIAGARFGYSSSVFSVFYRRDGSTPLTGDMYANDHAMHGVTTFNASGKITGKNIVTSIYHPGDRCDPDDENAFGSGGSGSLMVCVSGLWKYAVNNPAGQGAACSPEGVTGTSARNGETLVCRNRQYVRMANLIDKIVLVNRVPGVHDNSLVAAPECEAGGIPDASLLISSTAVNIKTLPPMLTMETYVTRSGANWLVRILLGDTSGGKHSGNDYGLAAILNLECRY